MTDGVILIATSSAVVHSQDGHRTWIHRGRTTVREGHPILQGREHMFRPLTVDYEWPEADTEAATGQAISGDQPPAGTEPDEDGDGAPEQASSGDQPPAGTELEEDGDGGAGPDASAADTTPVDAQEARASKPAGRKPAGRPRGSGRTGQ